MPRKSNKTSYVMNLITNGEEEQGQEGHSGQGLQNEQGTQAAQSGQNVQAAALNHAQTAQADGQNISVAQTPVPGASPEAEMKKVVVVDEDQESERLSEEIRGQLELELEAELKEQAGAAEREAPENVTVKTEAEAAASADTAAIKTEIAEPTMDTEMNTDTETMDAAADVTAAAETTDTAAEAPASAENTDTAAVETVDTVQEPAAVTENTNTIAEPAAVTETANTTTQPTQPTQPSQPGYRMVNVMETLVARVNLDKYIKEYGVCPCPRCRADVHALILTSLPSKYVVMDENAISLMLNFYESRRKTDIFTATLKACLEVKEHPRHEGVEGQ